MAFTIATFYGFFSWPDHVEARDEIYSLCENNQVIGTIYVSAEGINATLCGPEVCINKTISDITALPNVEFSEPKFSESDTPAFKRLRVKIKPEIVTMGDPSIDPAKINGQYVKPADWNELISSDDVTVIDTRNNYEYEIGSFANATNPGTEVFRDFPTFVEHKMDPKSNSKVALFCTGGIRCEKATSYLLEQGFSDVYHLEGGIIKYLEEIPASESLWEGDCYVFDDRVSVTHGLELGKHTKCTNCGMPVNPEVDSKFEPEVCCSRCIDGVTPDRRQRREMRLSQIQAASTQ